METGGAGGVEGAGRGAGRPCRDASRGASQHGLRSMVDRLCRGSCKALDRPGTWGQAAPGATQTGERQASVVVVGVDVGVGVGGDGAGGREDERAVRPATACVDDQDKGQWLAEQQRRSARAKDGVQSAASLAGVRAKLLAGRQESQSVRRKSWKLEAGSWTRDSSDGEEDWDGGRWKALGRFCTLRARFRGPERLGTPHVLGLRLETRLPLT